MIMAVFVTVLVVSNIASSAKIVDWGFSLMGLRMAFDADTLMYPIAYIFGDVLVTYVVGDALKKTEREDYIDSDTNFNPFVV